MTDDLAYLMTHCGGCRWRGPASSAVVIRGSTVLDAVVRCPHCGETLVLDTAQPMQRLARMQARRLLWRGRR